ncbi:MAG: 4Fe-4S dicluster domain-containing protein [Chloroflexota bacterium]
MSFHKSSRSRQTKFIRLNARRCQACWDCIEACPKDVLGQLEMGWHRHAVIKNAETCNGCRKCVRACEHGALEYIYAPGAMETKAERPALRQ